MSPRETNPPHRNTLTPLALWLGAISALIVLGAGCVGSIGAPGASPGGGTNPGGGAGRGGTTIEPGALYSPYTRLTRAEYQATIKAALGVDASVGGIPDDSRMGPFTSNVAVSPDPLQQFLLASEDLAALVVPSKLPACAAANAASCVQQNYQGPIERLYRRALTPAELTSLGTMITSLIGSGLTAENASRAMLTSVLISPDFLFRAQPVAGDGARLRRLAEHLSYALWDAPPDDALGTITQAAPSELGARLRGEAARLGKDARAVPVLARFLAQWLRVDVDIRLQDAGYSTSPLYLELLAFAEDALASNAPVTSFINGTRGFVQKDNFSAYGLGAVPSTAAVVPVTWPAGSPRRGVVGQEAIMDPTRHPDASRRPIFRGHLVRSSLLCDTILPPPPELQALAGEVADRTTDMRCSGCHMLMDPVGAAFASLDLDHTGPVPPAQLNNNRELGGTYADVPALLGAIAASEAFATCFSRQIVGFFLEQDPAGVDEGTVLQVADVIKGGGGIGDVFGQMVVSLEALSRTQVPWCAGQ